MSQKGLKLAAEAFLTLQNIRGELLRLGTIDPSKKSSQQDILLGQLLEDAKNHVKDEFVKLTMMKI